MVTQQALVEYKFEDGVTVVETPLALNAKWKLTVGPVKLRGWC